MKFNTEITNIIFKFIVLQIHEETECGNSTLLFYTQGQTSISTTEHQVVPAQTARGQESKSMQWYHHEDSHQNLVETNNVTTINFQVSDIVSYIWQMYYKNSLWTFI